MLGAEEATWGLAKPERVGLLGFRGSAIFATEGTLGAAAGFLASGEGFDAGAAGGALRTAFDGDGGKEPDSWNRDWFELWKVW